jgi:hypothetical protein
VSRAGPDLFDAATLPARGLGVFPVWSPVATTIGRLACGCGRDCDNSAKHPFARLAPKGCHGASKDEGGRATLVEHQPARQYWHRHGHRGDLTPIERKTVEDASRAQQDRRCGRGVLKRWG